MCASQVFPPGSGPPLCPGFCGTSGSIQKGSESSVFIGLAQGGLLRLASGTVAVRGTIKMHTEKI
jgi:hypothetical protein